MMAGIGPPDDQRSCTLKSGGPELWHGLLTVPLLLTAGLPKLRRPSVGPGGTVRRPYHNGATLTEQLVANLAAA
jgi:hypothetical protein